MDHTRALRPGALPCVKWRRRTSATIFLIELLFLAGCLSGTPPNQQAGTQVPTAAKVDDFFIVDCAITGQIRQLGTGVTYVTRRQAIKTSARDCQIRGGEYVAFDRANYATSLKVWLPHAEQGEPAAQTYVGEIFEKGLGMQPDYAAAGVWYRRAAEQGYSRAAINLGNLYERGLGVPKDPKQALNWYRRAAGLSNLSFEIVPENSAAEMRRLREQVAKLQLEVKEKQQALEKTQRELENLRGNVEQRRSEADSERGAVAKLRQELEALKKEQIVPTKLRALEQSIAEREKRIAEKDREVVSLRAALARLEAESGAQRKEIASLQQRVTNVGSSAVGASQAGNIGYRLPTKGISFGNYHALVIGIDNYQKPLSELKTAVKDAEVVGQVLREQYGFKVKLLPNATRVQILQELSKLKELLTEEDNLLIYYAGHGEYDRKNQRGYWQPIDAKQSDSADWISDVQITDLLNIMAAKQLLVVADSCYSGILTRSGLGRFNVKMSGEETAKSIEVMAQKRSRMGMTSGSLQPVLDSGGGQHSVFARPFIELLRANTGVLRGLEMFLLLEPRVAAGLHGLNIEQDPGYGPINFAGHESGDFFFVRTK